MKYQNTAFGYTKTSIGLRLLEKYATSIGGAINHRLKLKQKILVKDNHIILSEGLEKIMKIIKKKKLRHIKLRVILLSKLRS